MKQKVTIQVINAVRQGKSAASGREWKNQEVVVCWTETLDDGHEVSNYQLCSLRGEQVDRFAQLNPQPGMELNVDIAFGTRQYNGRVYNDNTLFV